MVQFRSETMAHGTLVIPRDRAHDFLDVIGRQCNIQIVDMNSHSSSRQYKKYIQRIDEMERILRFLFDEIERLPGADIIKGEVDNFLDTMSAYKLDSVEESLQKLYEQFVKFRDNNADLREQKMKAMEERAVALAATRSLLRETPEYVTGGALGSDRSGLLTTDVEQADVDMVGFGNVAGVIQLSEQEKFARTIFRATRGNAYTHFETISDQVTDTKTGVQTPVNRNVFVIYHQGTIHSAVAERILRICNAFGVSKYEWPRSAREAEDRIQELTGIIADKSQALDAYEGYFVDEIAVLLQVVRPGGSSLVEEWRRFCLKEKALYATLNLFEGTDVTLRADCWYPAADDAKVRELLMSQSNKQEVSAFLLGDSHPLSKSASPPTYFRCPDFTLGFQEFVNTYGVPRYKEANPAYATIVTLPFLFGIMYGDVGHGSIVMLFGLFLCLSWNSWLKNSTNEIVLLIGGGRYMILMMGMFAVYAGFLYNDFFALGMDIFGSRYIPKPGGETPTTLRLMRDPDRNLYPFGFDPAWKGAINETEFFNSFKMKFSVIIAFLQMGLGVIHKGSNALHFNDMPGFFFEFLPQILFLTSLVGYLDVLIYYKWLTDQAQPKPSIINCLINMFFFTVEDPFWPQQKTIQSVLVVLMLICIPWMLLVKPIVTKIKHDKAQTAEPLNNSANVRSPSEVLNLKDSDIVVQTDASRGATAVSHGGGGGGGHDEEEYSFIEDFIHQMIETIEFILGAISNTASYLRLWALSLAHQQLALVFFDNTVLRVLSISGLNVFALGIATFFAFGAFAFITLGVMLAMDSLECFLHALRLQWVEFQNKFYKADGHRLEPFSFYNAVTETTLE